MWSLVAGARDRDHAAHADPCRQHADHPGRPVRRRALGVERNPAGRRRRARRAGCASARPLVNAFVPHGRPSVAETATGVVRLGLRDHRPRGVPDHRRRADRRDHRHGARTCGPIRSPRAWRRPSGPSTSPRPACVHSRRPPPPRAGPRPVRDPRPRRSCRRRTSPATSAAAGRSATTAAAGSRSRRRWTAPPATPSASGAGWPATTGTSSSGSTPPSSPTTRRVERTPGVRRGGARGARRLDRGAAGAAWPQRGAPGAPRRGDRRGRRAELNLRDEPIGLASFAPGCGCWRGRVVGEPGLEPGTGGI